MLVPAKCPSCGDTIQVEQNKDSAFCPSCGAKFIVEKAINNYGTIINAQNVELHTDGITADNLLSIALDEAAHKNFDKACSYITKARERGARHAIFRTCEAYFADYQKDSGAAEQKNRIDALLKHLQEAHTVRQDASQDQQHRSWADGFYSLLTELTFKEITAARQTAVTALQSEPDFRESKNICRSGWQLAGSLEKFAAWAGKEKFFADDGTEADHPEALQKTWAREIMEWLNALSLCYAAVPKEDRQEESKPAEQVFSAAEAQQIYDMAARVYPLAEYAGNQSLAKRLIAPSQGGEGLHTHRLKTESEPEEHSVSDSVYFSGKIEKLPEIRRNTSITSGLLWGGCSTAAALVIVCPVTYFIWLLASAIFGSSFALCYTIAALGLAVVGFIGLIMYEGGYSGELDTYEYKKLFEEWKNSPAHGANQQDFEFKDFAEALDPRASALLKQKAAVLLNENSRFGWVYSNVLRHSKNTAYSDDRIVSGKGALLVLIAVLIAAYCTALCLCADDAAPAAEPAPAAVTSSEQPAADNAE